MDKTREVIGSTFFRKEKFKYKFDELMEMLSAKDISYKNLIFNKSGDISNQKTDKMIADLIQCLIEVRAYKRIYQEFTGGEMRYDKLTDKQTKFYHDFFYLILGLSVYSGDCDWSSGYAHAGGTFNAILDMPVSMGKELTKPELDRDIINAARETAFVAGAELRIPDGILARLTVAYRYVTGKDLTDILTKTEFQKGYELLTDIEKKLCDDPDYKYELFDKEQKEMDEALSMLDPEDFYDDITERYSEKELSEMEEESIMLWDNRDPEEDIVIWKRYFDDIKYFKGACKTVHKGLFDPAIKPVSQEELEDIIEIYMSKKGLSSWLDDDRFFTVYTYLTRICNRVAGRK